MIATDARRSTRRIGTRLLIAGALGVALGSCQDQPRQAQTQAETQASFAYVPLDPLPVLTDYAAGCEFKEGRLVSTPKPLLDGLPDNAVRVAIRQLDGSASASLGPAKMGAEGHQYQVVLDYINADVVNLRFEVFRKSDGSIQRLEREAEGQNPRDASETYEGAAPGGAAGAPPGKPAAGEEVVIPVYVGVGLRLTANVTVLKGKVNLSSLGALAAQAEAQNITGSLIVQTLGITGKQVTGALPLPSELNATTVQNAILALGSIKAIVYDRNTLITPRVTGIYNPLGASDERILNNIVSEIARNAVTWKRPCG
jgi:hypothetical protein